MIKLKDIVRSNILNLQPYSSAREEYTGTEGVFLDANENPFGELNRYPDPYQKALKQKIAALKNVNSKNIFVGNGSDEVIDLTYRIFCNPGVDKALVFAPSYGMYEVSAAINNVALLKITLTDKFQIDMKQLKPFLKDSRVKLIFICSPNNPTGNLMNNSDIAFILKNFNGIVFIDEAYIDFANEVSLIRLIEKYNNLIVSQTFSKAWGLAAARVGLAFANEDIIALFNKVKPPYNVSQLNQNVVLNALNKPQIYQESIKTILSEKERLIAALMQIKRIKKIYPSDANFLLLEVENADFMYKELVAQQIIIRNRNKQIDNCIRVTIGTPEENNKLIMALKKRL